MKIPSNYLTTQQVADKLQVHTETVRLWIRSRKMPAIAVGRQWRVHKNNLGAFIERSREQYH